LSPPNIDAYVGRQPIFGRKLEVYGYELLYRAGDTDQADFLEGDQATSQVLLNACCEIGLDRIVGQRRAFVNLTRAFVVGEYPIGLPPGSTVLEVLESVASDAEVRNGLERLKAAGYAIALDDYRLDLASGGLVDLADMIKLDCQAYQPDELADEVRRLHGLGLQLVAEKVETQEEFDRCRELGFDYFQGYFLSRPRLIHARTLPSNMVALLQLLSKLQNPDAEVDEVQELVSQDVTLSYRLLRHINSTSYALARSLSSVREAVMYLGLARVRNLASLFLLTRLDQKPTVLLGTAMQRARTCELLALAADFERPDAHFTVGLFSALDTLMDCPLERVLEFLPLAPPLMAALLRREGQLGESLACTLAYEQADWEKVRLAGLSASDIREAYLSAVAWAEETGRQAQAMAA
jgi:c-di-GMP phosphodiesterase